jgi:hypothetical protein
MIESGSCSRRSTAPLLGCSWCPAARVAAERMSAAYAVGTAAAVESSATAAAGTTSTAAGLGASSGVGTAPVGTATKTAAVGATVRTATVRTFSVMLSERGVRVASEGERCNRCKQEPYG